MMKNRFVPLAAMVALAGCAGSTPAPSPAPSTAASPTRQQVGQRPTGASAGQDTAGRAIAGAGGTGAPAPRPYNRVITPDAKTRRGMFVTHQVGDKLYFEIPARELGKDQLLVGRSDRAAAVRLQRRAADRQTPHALRLLRRVLLDHVVEGGVQVVEGCVLPRGLGRCGRARLGQYRVHVV